MAELIFPLSFKRQYGGSLDPDLVFETIIDRDTYLTNPLRYAGQIVACKELEGKIFVLNNAMDKWLSQESADSCKVKISADDTTEDFLENKITGTTNKISITKQSTGKNETLKFNISTDVFDKTVDTTDNLTESENKVFISPTDKTAITHTNRTVLDLVSGTNTGDETQSTILTKLAFTPEDIANKDTDGTLSSNSDTKYPSQKAVKTYADTKLSKGTADGYYEPKDSAIQTHISSTANPHVTTKEQVGLGNCDNTSDVNKPVSTATQTALDLKANQSTTYTKTETDNAISAVVTSLDWKESVATLTDIATTYPTPEDGWTVSVKDTDITYRYDGASWIPISANSIPMASASVDGKMSSTDYTKLTNITGINTGDETNETIKTKLGTDLSNKVDKVTGKSLIDDTEITRLASVTNYNDTNVQAHITDTNIHVTSTEKTTWNNKSNFDGAYASLTGSPTIPDVTNKLEATNLLQGTNVTLSKVGNDITINATGGGTSAVFTGATALLDGEVGLVVQPLIDDKDKYLKGDGTWSVITGTGTSDYNSLNNKPTVFIGTTTETNGVMGFVPTPTTTDINKFLSSNGGWETITIPTVDTVLNLSSTNAISNSAVTAAFNALTNGVQDYIGYFADLTTRNAYSGTVNGGDWCTVAVDSNYSNNTTNYIYNSTTSSWTYNGTVPTTQVIIDDSAVLGDNDVAFSADKTLALLATKPNMSVNVEASTSINWILSGDGLYYYQSVPVTGVTTDNTVIVSISPNHTRVQYITCSNAVLAATAQTTDAVTIVCYGTKPTIPIPLVFNIEQVVV